VTYAAAGRSYNAIDDAQNRESSARVIFQLFAVVCRRTDYQ
jgi:hypothetical protein